MPRTPARRKTTSPSSPSDSINCFHQRRRIVIRGVCRGTACCARRSAWQPLSIWRDLQPESNLGESSGLQSLCENALLSRGAAIVLSPARSEARRRRAERSAGNPAAGDQAPEGRLSLVEASPTQVRLAFSHRLFSPANRAQKRNRALARPFGSGTNVRQVPLPDASRAAALRGLRAPAAPDGTGTAD